MAADGMLRVALLTLAAHKDGVWIRQLANALTARSAIVSIIQIESLDDSVFPLSATSRAEFGFDVLVNRVSDTAAPALAKLASAFMQAVQLVGIPVVNDSRAFAAGINKTIHHALLAAAGLRSPASRIVRNTDALAAASKHASLRYPLLLKPNAAGFGRGQVRFADEKELTTAIAEGRCDDAFKADGVALLQNYHSFEATYRVWTLGERIQCSVRVEEGPACMSDVCAINKQRVVAWKPPADICAAVLRVMKLAGADCGSVEFLIEAEANAEHTHEHEQSSEQKAATTSAYATAASATVAQTVTVDKAIFFDMNLVSSLPDPAKVINDGGVWPKSADFYGEMADYIVGRVRAV